MSQKYDIISFVKGSIKLTKYSSGFCAFSIDENDKAFYKPIDFFLLIFHLLIGALISSFSLHSINWSSMKDSIIDVGNHVTANFAILVSLVSILITTLAKDHVWGPVLRFSDIDKRV